MTLDSITVQRYRSITSAKRIQTGRSTILVGPNNEGKSNLLRALVLAMRVLAFRRRFTSSRDLPPRFYSRQIGYDWDRDFPMHMQKAHPKSTSIISLDFMLTQQELRDFKREIGSSLTGNLPLKIAVGKDGPEVSVHKKGAGGPALTKKSARIADFVARRIDFLHIPAVRTAKSAQDIVTELVDRALRDLEDNAEYAKALKKIADLQEPLLKALSQEVKSTLVQFLPAVRDVQVRISTEDRHRALRRSCHIEVDDGSATLLQHKGDGVQSLAALAMMRRSSETAKPDRNLVIAIEEPESHLHPHAIHELRDVMSEMSTKHQVVLTTHNPLFVNRVRVGSNIIVHQKKAHPAKTIAEIREILGVRASDNLRHADLVLLVEGEDDRIALDALLPHYSRKLKQAIHNGTLVIDTLQGGSNLAYKLGILRDTLCLTHCLLDHDKAGRDGVDKAKREGLITDADVNFSVCSGKAEAEIEDWYNPKVYSDAIKNAYRVDLNVAAFRTAKKWSERMRKTFARHGKHWDDHTEKDVKLRVARVVAANPGHALLAVHRPAFGGHARALEQRLQEIGTDRKAS